MKKCVQYILVLGIMLVGVTASSQVPDPPGGGFPPCGEPFGSVCPIDGGISFLIAAGVALGGKKAYDLKKSKSE